MYHAQGLILGRESISPVEKGGVEMAGQGHVPNRLNLKPFALWAAVAAFLVMHALSAIPVHAGGSIELYGTFHAMGVIVTIGGSDDPEEKPQRASGIGLPTAGRPLSFPLRTGQVSNGTGYFAHGLETIFGLFKKGNSVGALMPLQGLRGTANQVRILMLGELR
jgi:hypothetical protein